jgi:hypothetical protein
MRDTYRVCAYTEDGETRVGLCHMSTNEDGTRQCTAVASTEVFATISELKRGLECMCAACELPVLMVTNDQPSGETFDESIDMAEHTAVTRADIRHG